MTLDAVVIDGNGDPVASRRFDDQVREAAAAIHPLTEEQARPAREAYRDYGMGSSHPAQLNFGDCFAYGLARSVGRPLLFKGSSFSRTDIASELPGATAAR
jgi:ribonuclease VapC